MWENCSRELKSTNAPHVYELWFRSIKAVRIDGDTLILGIRDEFTDTWLRDNYRAQMADIICKCADRPMDFDTIITPEVRESPPPPREVPQVRSNGSLNPRHTFKTFVVSNNNDLAHSAASSVAKSRGNAYNPLFIYGGVGLGKTHLLHAIGNYVMEHAGPTTTVRYLSCEKFVNEFINGIQNKAQMTRFRKKYRQTDYLLLDDVQFLKGKERTQEEFFHTFNELHGAGKQIVITCDCPPHVLDALEERLRSRFEWGLITDLQPPDTETRLAILRHKLKNSRADIPDEILNMMAERIRSNIRRLEGALVRVIAFNHLSQNRLTVKSAEELLQAVFAEEKESAVSVKDIQKAVSYEYGISMADMFNRKRPEPIAFPRQVAMYLSRKLTDLSLSVIGESFNRNHGTVLHACKLVRNRIDTNSKIRARIEQLERQLRR